MENFKFINRTKEIGTNKSLLNKDLIPGIVYGKGTEPTKIACSGKIIKKLTQQQGFYATILSIEINGKVEKVLPKSLQYHPVTDKIIHIDLLRVQENTKVTVDVPVEFLNQDKCPGLKKGGVLNIVRRNIELICNANSIPNVLKFDLVETEIGDAIKISNINLPVEVKPTIIDRDFVVATLVPPTVEVEESKPESEETTEGEEQEKTEEKKDETKSEVKEKEPEKKPEKKQ